MLDMLAPGTLLSAVWVVLITILMVSLGSLVGFL